MPIVLSVKAYAPSRMQSTMDTVSCPKAAASLAATYLQFPVAEKYRIIQHLRKQQFLCISVTDYTIPSHPVQPHFPPSISTRAIVYIS